MASADLRQELNCSICLSSYTDPVMLTCGHNYCQDCINRALDTEQEEGHYSCPQCRKCFWGRPKLQKNITLCNIVEILRSTHLDQEGSEIFCTQRIHYPVPAVKSCLLCEASLCDNHLKVHSKSPEHILTNPTTSMEKRKCSIHRELLKYYCTADAACMCESCRLDGDHLAHQVETLDEASERKKQELRNVSQKLNTEREITDNAVQILLEYRLRSKENIADERNKLSALFRDLRRHLEDLEKRVLSDITRQEENLSLSLSDQIQHLEIKKEKLSRKMGDIEKLCNMTDPLTVLQESDTGDLCDTEDTEGHDNLPHVGGDLDVIGISHTLHTGLSDMIKEVNECFIIQEASDLVLDVNTAHNKLHISDDMKTVFWSGINQNRTETPERFYHCQVISSQRFSSGRHYWDVDVSKSERWGVGMCYPSIERGGRESLIGHNNKSWALCRSRTWNTFVVTHNNQSILITDTLSSNTVRVYLDYEAGQLSFYELCDPIRHLHTFNITFTEPLHAVLCVHIVHMTISGGVRLRRHDM